MFGGVGRVDQDLDAEIGEGARTAGMVRVAVRADDAPDLRDRSAEVARAPSSGGASEPA